MKALRRITSPGRTLPSLLVSISFSGALAQAQTSLEPFEFATTDDLVAAWRGSANAIVTVTDSVAPTASGKKAMSVQFNFPSSEWATEFVDGPELPAPVSIGSAQYLTFRIKGDPAFTAADFKNLYLYAYDDAGNFGRWGTTVPTTADWQILNFAAATIEKPWNSPALPDLSRILRFAFYQYGSQAAIEPYSATLVFDELTVRDTPLAEVPTTVESTIDGFEYADADALRLQWTGSANTEVGLTESVSPRATGKTAMKLTFHFPSSEWATETAAGTSLAKPIAIGAAQYLTFRIQGDPAFSGADFRYLYLYAYDEAGNFGRWGGPVPTTADWQVVNYGAAAMEKPWDSPALPDLAHIVRFSFFQYGSQAALPPYDATVSIDELMIRNKALTEFPLPAAPRSLVDDFEGYADTTALMSAYAYMNSPATTVTTASLVSPAPQGAKALQLAIDFAAGQYPWGSIRSSVGAPFSLPTNAVVSMRVKGDPALAPVADDGTSFWLSFYDQSGNPTHFVAPAAVVTSGEWTTLQARFADFSNTSTIDVGNLVRWRILVQGWTGTTDSAPLSGSFQVDDVRITTESSTAPSLGITRSGNQLTLSFSGLTAGKSYELRATTDVTQWANATVTTLQANAPTATTTVTPTQAATFYRLVAP